APAPAQRSPFGQSSHRVVTLRGWRAPWHEWRGTDRINRPRSPATKLEESPGHLLRYVSRFFFQCFPWHRGIFFCAGSHGYGEDLVANNADDLLSMALAFAVHSTGHCFI